MKHPDALRLLSLRRLALALCCCAPALGACGKSAPESPKALVAQSGTEVPPMPVQVATLEPANFVDSVTLYGRVEARQRVRISAEIPGRIEGLPFAEGERVGRGQTLARINARLISAQVDQANAAAELARATLARTQALFDKKLATGQDLDLARAQAAQSEAGLEIARANLDKAVIRSPIDGQVTLVRAKVGELASPGIPLLEVVDTSQVEIRADIAERDVTSLQLGSSVEVEFEGFAGRTFEGKVAEVGLVADATTRTFPVKVSLDNDAGALRPGMLARVTLVRERLENVVVVPRDAVLDEVDGKSVYLVQGEIARRQRVQLGPTRGAYAVVREGIAAQERLVVLGHRQVVDGQRVEVTKDVPCCAARDAKGEGAPARVPERAPALQSLPRKG